MGRLECSAARAPPSQGVKYIFVKKLLSSAAIMLSRLAVRSAMVPRCLAGARELATTPALAERDLVNFPPRQRPIERGPVKALIFPAEWFDALYPKTGVTGPYMALFGVSACLAQIKGEQAVQEQATAWQDIIAAKKEAVGLQLEGEYRSRLAAAHSAVKKRLDYQVETANVLRRMEQKHMV